MIKGILVTGVSSGIGYDAVRYFVAQGYHVFGSVRNDVDRLKLERDFPQRFTCLKFDVTHVEQIMHAKEVVAEKLNGELLTALVNNAGFVQGGPMALLSDHDFRQQMEVNVFGVRNVINIFLPLLGTSKQLKGQPGKIINISSISGIFNTPMNGAYCVSKHAMESLGEIYRRELMIFGIQVTSIQPGPIQSDLWEKNLNCLNEFTDSDYGRMAKAANCMVQKAQKNALPAAVISKLIHHIILSKRPKLSYVVARNKFLPILMAKYTPKRIVDYFLYRSLVR